MAAPTSNSNCVFCKIVAGQLPCYKVWEDAEHLAFLTLHPNTEGVTLVITKGHHDSDFAGLPQPVLDKLMAATATVARLLTERLDDVGRTGLVFEGMGVNHIHAKLVPMHGTRSDRWVSNTKPVDSYFRTYPGYISSHDAAAATPEQLTATAKKITG